jgi:hypothetical protein
MDTRRRTVRRAAIAVVTLAVAAGCGPPIGLVVDGRGEGVSVEFPLREGAYQVRWSAHDAGLTDHGCLFGLTIEPTVDGGFVNQGRRERTTGASLKLSYVSTPAGGQIDGNVPALALDSGVYRLRSEGNCAWQAEILPAEPGASVKPRLVDDTSEQG